MLAIFHKNTARQTINWQAQQAQHQAKIGGVWQISQHLAIQMMGLVLELLVLKFRSSQMVTRCHNFWDIVEENLDKISMIWLIFEFILQKNTNFDKISHIFHINDFFT